MPAASRSLDGPAGVRASASSSATSATPPSSPSSSTEHDAVVHYAAESHNDNSLSGPAPFVTDQPRRHLHAARKLRARPASATTTSPPMRCTAISNSTIPQRFTESTPYNPSSPYSSTKAGSDLLVRAWVRSFGVRGDDQQLLEQLRTASARGEVHPAPDHERDRRRPPAPVRRGPERARLDPRGRPLLGRPARSSKRGRIGETYLIGADGEKSNREVVETHPRR